MKKKMSIQTFVEAEAYLNRYLSSRWSYTLSRMQKLMAELGNPEKKLRIIHVGGTAGKGSTCYMTASILEEAGYTVGLHMSPHMISVRERLMINRKPITTRAFVQLLNTVVPAIEKVSRINRDGPPTYYEITVAMMFKYFAEKHVDVAVVEVGLGGKLDGTNILSPAVSIINNVGLDHTEILGDTIEKIASDKREIIKTGRPSVSAATQPSVRKLIIEKAQSVNSELSLVDRDFSADNIQAKHYNHIAHAVNDYPIQFDYHADNIFLKAIHLSLFGKHQASNAAVAITAVRLCGLPVPEAAIRKALSSVDYMGRLEVATIHDVPVLIDGAHNPMKMNALAAALTDHFAGQQFPILIAVKGDKKVSEMVSILAPHVSHWFVTTLERQTDWGKRVMFSVNDLANVIHETDPGKPLTEIPSLLSFLSSVHEKQLLITGSLYLVGAVEEFMASKRSE